MKTPTTGKTAGFLWGALSDEDMPGNYVDDEVRAGRKLLTLTNGALESRSGLKFLFRKYFQSGVSENALSHIFKHTRDDLTKNYHGVFDKTGSALVEQIDNMWAAAKNINWDLSKATETIGNITRSVAKNGNTNYLIETGVRVGYEGGKKGSGAALTKILISTEKNSSNAITAFPSN